MSVVANFAAFRDRKKVTKMEEAMQCLLHDAVEKLKEEVTTAAKPARGGGGISASRVVGLETRVLSLENNPSGGLSYISLTDTGTTSYKASDFIFGTNIIGVNAPGPVTIQLPQTLTAGTIVKIKDESFSALTNNITVETYLEVL